MLQLFKRILLFLSALLALVPLAVGVGAWWLKSKQPAYAGVIDNMPVEAPVRVLFDEFAVPHVFAESWPDVHFTMGYLHARDRLWQMEMQRRVGQGRMAEIVGGSALDLDRFMRTLGLYRAAEQGLPFLSAQTVGALESYANGVNHYLENRQEPLPLEFQITQHEPEPWRLADSVVWTKTMSLILSGNYRSEMRRARLLTRITPSQLAELFPAYPHDGPVTVPDAAAAPAPLTRLAQPARPTRSGMASVYVQGEVEEIWPLGRLRPGDTRASNQWVVAAHYTESGAPVLANDPHLSLDAPSLWYLARAEVGDRRIGGATVPGLPFHLLGQNESLAWAITNTGSDVQDLVVERLQPESPGKYRVGKRWLPVEERVETIKVRFSEDVRHPVRRTRHGPLLSDVSPMAAAVAGDGHVLALAFTALQAEDRTLDAIGSLTTAKSWKEARSALQLVAAPQVNFLVADNAGNVGFMAPGTVPIRNGHDGRLPVPGEALDRLWIGVVPRDDLPALSNPLNGWIANANNPVVGADYQYALGHDWEAPFRAARIGTRLDQEVGPGRPPYAIGDAKDLQLDIVSLAARELLPNMTRIRPKDADARLALERLRAWDARMDRNMPEPAIFYLWLSALERTLFADELGALYAEYSGLHPRAVAQVLRERQQWCDDVRSRDAVETCEEMLAAALSTALSRGRAILGDDMDGWRWGTLHRAPLRHPLLARIPVLREIFDIGVETEGGNYTLNRGAAFVGGAADREAFDHVHGPGYRALYDLGAPERSQFALSTGQSGNPLSRHYDDQVGRWRDGNYLPLFVEPDSLLARALGVLELRPKAR